MRGEQRGHRQAVRGEQVGALGRGLGDVQVQQQAVLAGRGGGLAEHAAAAPCRRRAGRCRTRRCRRRARSAASSTAACSCSSNGGRPGSGSSGVAMIARAPVAADRGGDPLRVEVHLDAGGHAVAQHLRRGGGHGDLDVLGGQPRLARPHDLLQPAVQRQPSPWPRNSTIGACEWALTRPGSRTPGSSTTSASSAGGASAAGRPSRSGRRRHRGRRRGSPCPPGPPRRRPRAVKRCGMVPNLAARRPAGGVRRRQARPGAADTVEPCRSSPPRVRPGRHHRLAARPGRHARPGRRGHQHPARDGHPADPERGGARPGRGADQRTAGCRSSR